MNNQAYEKGRRSYDKMLEACDQLVSSGNWQRVGASDIRLFLDMYVQSLLLRMAQVNGTISQEMIRFTAEIPSRDVLSIGKADPEKVLQTGYKNRSFAEGTPLLLKCVLQWTTKTGQKAHTILSAV